MMELFLGEENYVSYMVHFLLSYIYLGDEAWKI